MSKSIGNWLARVSVEIPGKMIICLDEYSVLV